VVDEGGTGDSIDDLSGRELHVECYGVSVAGIIVHEGHLLENRLDLQSGGDSGREFVEIIGHDCGLNNLEVDIDSFVKIGNDEEVVK
jgi:hypothetical protein